MPRKRRFCPPGYAQHVIQRGNNRQACFGSDADKAAYANWLLEAAQKYGLEIHAWVFMTNHVHLLVTPTTHESLSLSMQYLGRLYVRHFNFTYNRTGSLYEGRFKSHIVQGNAYLLACQRYIELNPVRAGMVKDPADFVWSSYRSSAFGLKAKLYSPHVEYLALGDSDRERQKNYRELVGTGLEEDLVDEIRNSVNKGKVLGEPRFRDHVENLAKKFRGKG